MRKSPQNYLDYSHPKKLQKSQTRTEGIVDKTTSRQIYLQRERSRLLKTPSVSYLEEKSTEKKRCYPTPVLLQQNRTLLAQNREMALLIHERNSQIEALERKFADKIEGQQQLFREIEAQKERFVGEVLRHKQETERKISFLEEKVRNLEDQKIDISNNLGRQFVLKEQMIERQRRQELQALNLKFQESLSLLQAQKMKIKSELEHRQNEFEANKVINKQQSDKLRYELEESREQTRHAQHLRKLEQSELKQQYENRIQKMSLQNRKQKQIFLLQHESHIKKLQEDIKRLNKQRHEFEESLRIKHIQFENNSIAENQQKQRLINQFREEKEKMKQLIIKQKQSLNQVMKTEYQVHSKYSNVELEAWQKQNQHLLQLLSTKTQEIKRLHSEIDTLRQQHEHQLQNNQKILELLHQKMATNYQGNEEEKELLKIKLTVLRDADINSLKNYYQHQITILSEQLNEKESILQTNRNKLQEQFKKKDEIKKNYELRISSLKQEILSLQNKTKMLQSIVSLKQDSQITNKIQSEINISMEDRNNQKVDKSLKNQIKNLQALIQSKDLEIQDLLKRIDCLRVSSQQQIQQKSLQIQMIIKQHSIEIQAKEKKISELQYSIQKNKELFAGEKAHYQQQIHKIKQQKRQYQEKNIRKNALDKEEYQRQRYQLKSQIRNLTLQLQNKEKELISSHLLKDKRQAQLQDSHTNNSNQQRIRLEEFYVSQLQVKEEQLLDLRERNTQLTNDILDARQNYCNLEKKLQSLIQSQSGLREVQKKVVNIGKQNNVLRNKVKALQ